MLNTVARAMGFPIRQISNFDSAHEVRTALRAKFVPDFACHILIFFVSSFPYPALPQMPEVPGEYKQEIVRYWERNSRRMMQERGQVR